MRTTDDGGLLHDIGHEVATLAALVAAIRDDARLDGPLRARVTLLEREVDQLLDLVGAASPGPGPDRSGTDLRPLLAEVAACRDAASPGTVALRPGPVAVVRADPVDLRRLVTNLVDNAVRAAGEGGRVEIAVELLDGGVPAVRVLDDGPGPGRGPGGRHGVGLGIVAELAARLGARVTLRSRAERGTVAEIVLGPRPTRRRPSEGDA